jgi:hypothetical protein
MKILASVPAFALALALSAPAHALLVEYPNFNDTSDLTFVGDATTQGSPAVLHLTSSTGYQSGAAYSTSAVTLGSGATFSTQFQFRLTQPGGIDPADGFTFVLAKSTTGLGSSGGGLGYQGVGNSVAIEFDTFNNGSDDGNSSNHVGIDINGSLNSESLTNVYGLVDCNLGNATTSGCMANGQIWTALIEYDGTTQLLNVILTDPTQGTSFHAITDYMVDIESALDSGGTAYVGFTSATGSGYENHDILNWRFSDSATLPPPVDNGVPEPLTLGLFGAGFAGLAVGRRKNRR